MEPVEWTDDGWVKASGADIAAPLPVPAGGEPVPHGFACSNDFSTDKIGVQWTLFRSPGDPRDAVRVADGALHLRARGFNPNEGAVLSFITGEHDYEMQVEVEIDPGATGGLLVFYSERLFAGLALSDTHLLEDGKGDTSSFAKPVQIGRRFFLRLRLRDGIMTTWHSPDGEAWTRHWMQFEVSCYHHNVAGAFLSLRPALFAGGEGEVRFRDFRFRVIASA